MAAVATLDREVGPSPCCPEAEIDGRPARLRYSEPCHANYCDSCDRWHGDPYVEPDHLGPTWQRDEHGAFVAPKHSLAPALVAFAHRWLVHEDGRPWRFTREQIRLLFWIYAVDDRGRFIYRELNIQRMKGWGKDPFLAVLCVLELLAPVRFSHWDEDGKAVGREVDAAWITVAAVSKTQTQNTMKIFPALIPKETRKAFGVVVGKEQVVSHGGQRSIIAVTSSPATLEGNRPTFAVGNEPHHWKENNDGIAMRNVMVRNVAKIPGGQARICWITNAYSESEGSVAQMNREGYEEAEAGSRARTGVLYDSVEAPENARMVEREIPVVLQAVRGDAWWLDIETLTSTMLDRNNSVTESRRFYYNQVGASEEAWLDPLFIRRTVHPQVKAWRDDPDIDGDALRLGWAIVDPKDEICVFFDGGKNDDHTALSGCRISDGYTFALGRWARPESLSPKMKWWTPRNEVDDAVMEIMQRFRVVALWGDPSHVKDDESDVPYWDGTLNAWHRRYKDRLLYWATKTGELQHSVMWDMTSPGRQAIFVPAAQKFVQDMEDGTITHDGHPSWVRYMRNARDFPTKWGTSLWKGSRGSQRKIDGAVTHVGARMMRDLILNKGLEKQAGGKAWGAW